MNEFVLSTQDDFEGWREAAKMALAAGLPPSEVAFRTPQDSTSLFGALAESQTPFSRALVHEITVPKAFIDLAKQVACHSDDERYALLYRLLVRLQSDKALLHKVTDPDMHRALRFAKEVRRDIHKMKAFVRFRKVSSACDAGDMEQFVAWFEPTHHIVRRAAPFFTRRFSNMRWSILTPMRCAHWDGQALTFTHGVLKSHAPESDALEDYWRSYYASIFNPARLKISAMTSEMPKKYWKNLPETELIPGLIKQSQSLEKAMLENAPTVPRPAMMAHRKILDVAHAPPLEKAGNIEALNAAIKGCRNCPLWQHSTQAVCGAGPENADIMLVGEQPGDKEDLSGKPFIGPAGQLLHKLLGEAGIEKSYTTNAVKHFKFEPRGKRRLHKNPSASEIEHCRPWLMREIQLVSPKIIVALGNSALHSLTGKKKSIAAMRGVLHPMENGAQLVATHHPSYVLRLLQEEEKREVMHKMLADLTLARQAAV